jgi:hypothetical protein
VELGLNSLLPAAGIFACAAAAQLNHFFARYEKIGIQTVLAAPFLAERVPAQAKIPLPIKKQGGNVIKLFNPSSTLRVSVILEKTRPRSTRFRQSRISASRAENVYAHRKSRA